MAAALRLYASLGFVREHDLAPIRGVPYARYVPVRTDHCVMP
jgi:hypothetical protein